VNFLREWSIPSCRETSRSLALPKRNPQREMPFGPAYRLFYEEPIHIVRRRRLVFDSEGKRYLDVYNTSLQSALYPRVVAAICEQAGAQYTPLLHEPCRICGASASPRSEQLANVIFTARGAKQ